MEIIDFYSGPYRFYYDSEREIWYGDEEEWLLELLNKELEEVLGEEVQLVYESGYL